MLIGELHTLRACEGRRVRTSLLPRRMISLLCSLMLMAIPSLASAGEREAAKRFKQIREDPVLLREFLFRFPKGADLHTHVDGAVYAENMIRWAAEDGRCVNLRTLTIVSAPCNAADRIPAVADIATDSNLVNLLIDAFSTRNFEQQDISGHEQFFSTFSRFSRANTGREGHMLDEVSRRSAQQSVFYIELMQGWGMDLARDYAAGELGADQSAHHQAIDEMATKAIAMLDRAEKERRDLQSCGKPDAHSGCVVELAYLGQVLRVFPRQQVRAQTQLAVRLMQRDKRFVGFNFVAPEDAPVSLRDYRWHMQMIAEETQVLTDENRNFSLHAGELALGLVPPEQLGFHIREAVQVAGARRIGHGVDIIYDPGYEELLMHMANQQIAVEINLTSNADILGISGDQHPFNLYRQFNVPLTLSTDDEGVSRIDLTHEYQRAVESYELSYADIKHFSRNALEYSFAAGKSLFVQGDRVKPCRRQAANHDNIAVECQGFLQHNKKASLQWQHEQLLMEFEAQF